MPDKYVCICCQILQTPWLLMLVSVFGLNLLIPHFVELFPTLSGWSHNLVTAQHSIYWNCVCQGHGRVHYRKLYLKIILAPFSCLGTSMYCIGIPSPDRLRHQRVTATLEFGHKEWLLSLETFRPFRHSEWQKDKKKTKRQRAKETKILKGKKETRKKDIKTGIFKRQRPEREFDIVMSGQFRTLAIFCSLFLHIKIIFCYPLLLKVELWRQAL